MYEYLFAVSGGLEYYGHEIISRSAFMSEDGKQTFIDFNVDLVAGTLKAYR